MVVEGEVLQLRGKLQEAKAAEAERDQLRARVKELEARKPKGQGPVQQQQGVGTEGGEGGRGKDRAGGGGGGSTSSVLPRIGGSKPRPPGACCPRWVGQCDCCCRGNWAKGPLWKVQNNVQP